MEIFEKRKFKFIKNQLKEKIPKKKNLQYQLMELKKLKKLTNNVYVLSSIRQELNTISKKIKKLKQELGIFEKHRRNWKKENYKKKNYEFKVYDSTFFIELPPHTFILNQKKLIEVSQESEYHFIDINGQTIIKKNLKNVDIYSIDEVKEQKKKYDIEINELTKLNKQIKQLIISCDNYEKENHHPSIKKLSKVLKYYMELKKC